MKKSFYTKALLVLGVFTITMAGSYLVLAQSVQRVTDEYVSDTIEMSPKTLSGVISFAPSYWLNNPFRLVGSAAINAITTAEESDLHNVLVGYPDATQTPDTAVMVTGGMQVESLANPIGISGLCVDDFGVLTRCPGVAQEPPVCRTHGALGIQLATDTATGCIEGHFFDLPDSGATWTWGCRSHFETIAMNPSHPSDITCTHVNNFTAPSTPSGPSSF